MDYIEFTGKIRTTLFEISCGMVIADNVCWMVSIFDKFGFILSIYFITPKVVIRPRHPSKLAPSPAERHLGYGLDDRFLETDLRFEVLGLFREVAAHAFRGVQKSRLSQQKRSH